MKNFDSLKLTNTHFGYVKDELPMWHQHYYQNRGTVIDIGAGCGETAMFFLNHGADRVIAIEADSIAIKMFQENFPESYIVPENAKIVLIPAHIDHVKVDIEGAEKGMIIETHFPLKWNLIEKNRNVTRLWRLDMINLITMHLIKIRIAHRIRLILDRVKGK